MADKKTMAAYWRLPIPKLKQLFGDLNSLGEYIIADLESKGKKDEADTYRAKLARQQKLQEMFIERRTDPAAFEKKYGKSMNG